jgi:LCP family protein required for cell wall assembly
MSGDTPPAAGGDQPDASGPDLPAAESTHQRPRWRRALKWISITLASILVLATGAVVADYFYINGLIKTQAPILPPGVTPPPKVATKAQNFLLIGSDTRQGASGKGTGGSKISGARSDTTIILHISANNSGATLISIPRDSYVQIPACVVGPHNQLSSPETNKFNAAYSIGGEYDVKYAASCTLLAVEKLTHIHIDHYAVIDFAGFKRMIDALGGVKMCVAHDLYDPIVNEGNGAFHGSGLDLKAGKNVKIDGVQALALMRARYALDGGGDLPRIKRQQEFIGAMIRKATSTSLLVSPFRLQSFLKAAASSLTTDGFGLGTMHKLAGALHNVGAGGVRLLTVPNLTSAPGMPYGDVEWDPSKAPALWNAIKHDQPIPGSKPTPSASPSASPTPTPSGPPLSVAPSSITVNVMNGTAQSGLAHKVATALAAKGFQIGTIGDASKSTYTSTVVKYGTAKVQSSQTVSASIPGSIRQADPTAGSSITVIAGANYTKVVHVKITSPTSPTSSPTPKISSFSAAKQGCLS